MIKKVPVFFFRKRNKNARASVPPSKIGDLNFLNHRRKYLPHFVTHTALQALGINASHDLTAIAMLYPPSPHKTRQPYLLLFLFSKNVVHIDFDDI